MSKEFDKIKVKTLEKKELEGLDKGPVVKRGCTDIIFCLLMIGLVGYQIYLFYFGFTNGDPNQIITFFTRDTVACGLNLNGKDATGYPLAYIQSFSGANFLTDVICIDKCPTATSSITLNCYNPTNNNQCTGTRFDLQAFTLSNLTSNLLVYDSYPLFSKFCVPNQAITAVSNQASLKLQQIGTVFGGSSNTLSQWISDINKSRWYFLYISLFAIVITMIFLFIIQYTVGIFVWVILLLYLLSCFLGGYFLMLKSNELFVLEAQANGNATNASNASTIDQFTQIQQANDLRTQSSTYINGRNLQIISIVLYVVGGLSFLILCCSFSSISVAIAVLETAALFTRDHFFIIFIPIIMLIFILGYLIFWAITMAYLWSVGTVSTRNQFSPLGKVLWTNEVTAYIWTNLFSMFWITSFFNYLGIFIIGCSCSIWFFNYKSKTSKFPILTSVKLGLVNHLGSIALAAFILAIVKIIKFILYYIQKEVYKAKDKGLNSKIIDFLLKILICYVQCFERVIKYISTLGLIQVAVSGKNFCRSCINAVLLFVANPLKFGLASGIGEIIILIGTLFTCLSSAMFGYVLITQVDTVLNKELYSAVIPTIIFGLIGIVVGKLFFSVYGIAINASLMCYFILITLDENSINRNNIPKPMADFLKKNKK